MKFWFVVILMMVILSSVFPAVETRPSVTINQPEEGDVNYADCEPSVDLKLVPSDSFSYVFGFSESETSINPQPEFDLSRNISSSNIEFSQTSRVYVYWDIFGIQPFRLQLKASGPLTSDSGYTMPWKISWTDKSNTSEAGTTHALDNNNGYVEPETVMVYTVPETGFPEYEDTVQLTISPDGDGDISAEIYKATLTLCVNILE